MCGFRFRSSLKKWTAQKASGPERHPLDSAEPITTPLILKHPESECFADWFLGHTECSKRSDCITITIGAWSGRGWFETIQAHITHVLFFFLEENSNRRFRPGYSRSHWNIRWWGGNTCGIKRGHCNYIQRIDRLWKITAVPVTTWHMQCVKRGSVGNTRLLPRAKMLLVSMNFFSSG